MISTIGIIGVAAAVFFIAAPVKIYTSIASGAECQAAKMEFEQKVEGHQHRAQLRAYANTDYFARSLAVVQVACQNAGEQPSYTFLPAAVVLRAQQLAAQVVAAN